MMVVADGKRIVGQVLSVETEDGKVALLMGGVRVDITQEELDAKYQLVKFV